MTFVTRQHLANHYSRRVYLASTLHLGVWIDRRLVGVLQYGYAMNPASAGSVVTGTLMTEYLELNRMWLDDAAPCNGESKALAFDPLHPPRPAGGEVDTVVRR